MPISTEIDPYHCTAHNTDWYCCPLFKYSEGEGDCDGDYDCIGNLKCGKDNCDIGHWQYDCCYKP